MEKRIFALLLCALLLVCTAAAAELNRVADNAGLLSTAQASALNTRCRTLSEQYDLDIIIATTEDSRGMELGQYAASLVDYNDFRTDNIILVIAMDQRKYVCVTTGKGIDAFSDQDLESIYDAMESDMRAGNYSSACNTFLSRCSTILTAYANGTGSYSYYGTGHAEGSFAERLKAGALFALIPAIGIGWLIASAQKSKMKTARRRDSAENYMTGMNLTRERDIYLYTTTVRHRIAQNPPPGGRPGGGPHGGGGTHHTFTGGSGARHGGGGGGRGF